jgi:hypothetical protein
MNGPEFLLNMLPYYLMGLLMFTLVYFSEYRSILRVEKAPLIKFLKFMLYVTILRIVMFTLTNSSSDLSYNENIWSLISVLFVPWEDLCHSIPLVLLGLLVNSKSKIFKAIQFLLMLVVMLAFGSGHLYQGMSSVFILSLYIPFTLWIGKKRGFGTVMVAHVIYDFVTVLTCMLF